MANPELVKILKEGVSVWNRWRGVNTRIFADLMGADLRGANLAAANLRGVNLTGGDLTSANLAGACLIDANLTAADLRWTDLSETNLGGADLTGAYIFNSDFTRSLVGFTIFGNNDLSTAKGIDTVHHLGPSIIGVDTIYSSQGNIPEAFLRGAGVPEVFIAQLKPVVIARPAYYSCFISYNSKDDNFIQHLYAGLQQQGVRCWATPKDLKVSEAFRVRINESIRFHAKLVLVFSANSIHSSWAREEVEAAMEKERNQKQGVLVSIKLDDEVIATDQPWAVSLRRTRPITDFSAWKEEEAYKTAFDDLLRNLKL